MLAKYLAHGLWRNTFRKLFPFSVPAAVILASVVMPLQPLVRQALIGIILIWFPLSWFWG